MGASWRDRPMSMSEARTLSELAATQAKTPAAGLREAALFMVFAETRLPHQEIADLPYDYDTSHLSADTRERIEDWKECFQEPYHLLFCKVTARNVIVHEPLTASSIRDKVSRWRNPHRRPVGESRINRDGEPMDNLDVHGGKDGLCACASQPSGFCNGKRTATGDIDNCRWMIWNKRTTHRARIVANQHARMRWLRANQKKLTKRNRKRRAIQIRNAMRRIDAEYPV